MEVTRNTDLVFINFKLVAKIENETEQNDPKAVADEEDNPKQITSIEDSNDLHEDDESDHQKQFVSVGTEVGMAKLEDLGEHDHGNDVPEKYRIIHVITLPSQI